MRTTGEVIKALRKEYLLTQKQLAEKINVSKSTIGMWENNVREPNKADRESICDFFHVDMNYLFGKTCIRNDCGADPEVTKIRLYKKLGDILQLCSAKDVHYFTVPSFLLANNGKYFAVIVPNNSMSACGIFTDDIVIFQECKEFIAGQVFCFIFQNQVTCRKVFSCQSNWLFMPSGANPTNSVINVEDSLLSCLGKLTAIIHRYPNSF